MSDEGEDPSPRPKRKLKKVMVLSSTSSSDSDDSGPTTTTRKKRLRVLSEDGSDSSSGSWAMGAIRRRRALPGLRDSDGDSDSSGWATEHSDSPQTSSAPGASTTINKSPANKTAKAVSGFSSDSSEGNSEKCSICLMKFLNQEVGTPQNCEHVFCLDCITEWSKNMNTCPVDRITFESIVVRACAGGRVLRTEPVKVERRPSLEMMIIEDPTVCEVCHNADREESMLLCDGCDLGFHMQCLTPPLTRIPEDQWLCPNCNGVWRSSPIFFPMQSSHSYGASTGEGSSRGARASREAEPSTSSGRRRDAPASAPAPPASRAPRASRSLGGASSSRRTTTPRSRKRKYTRRTRTVIVEYEVQGEGKFPITKRRKVKTRIKKRRTKKRQPRTAARRTHVLASVRAKLASVREEGGSWGGGSGGGGSGGGGELSARRAGAGIPALSLFGSRDQLDYFEEEDERGSEGASTAVAVRPTSSIFSAYRQARRKMISIPSPTHASSAPDLLSDILESQARLHSKDSVVSVTVDGSVNIKLQRRKEPKPKEDAPLEPKPKEDAHLEPKSQADRKVDLTKGGTARQAPSYPGQGRGWGGGYRYPREQNNHQQNHNQGNQAYGRGGYDNGYGGPQQRGPGGPGGPGGPSGHFDRRDENNGQFNDYHNRRPHQYPNDDEPWHERNRRQPDLNRGLNNQRMDERRFSGGPAWRPHRPDMPPQRQSFGGFENPLDMRMGHEPPHGAHFSRPNPPAEFSRPNPFPAASPQEKPQPYRPLPQPPAFELEATPALERDKSEDERSDEGLVIDTEKYDPTEPTNDDDSGEEDTPDPAPAPAPPTPEPERPPSPSPPATAPLPPPPLPPEAPCMERILAGLDAHGLAVSADVLDSAVRAALEEHRALRPPTDDFGACPNFSIYSATSVHIASDSSRGILPPEPAPPADCLEDLVQEDGELTPPPLPSPLPSPPRAPPAPPSWPGEKTAEEYKAKVSKRCPITTNTRNPIKIKLNTPSLIKRQVSLYDEEDLAQEAGEGAEAAADPQQVPAAEALGLPDEPTDDEIFPSEPESDRKISPDDRNDDLDIPEPETRKEEREDESGTPHISDEDATPKRADELADEAEDKDFDDDRTDDELDTEEKDKAKSESDSEASSASGSRRGAPSLVAGAAKMTESISETEDERSYTPCLDENKSKDASLEDKGIEGLDTEMISEEEANDMFSEGSPPGAPLDPAAPVEDGEIPDRRPKPDDAKRKRKKDGKKEKEGKAKGRTKRGDVTFKKMGKGKERNYREREKEKRRSASSTRSRRRRKDKRKDLERYDVRTLVSGRRRRTKDAFGRDVSPGGSREPSARASSSPPRARRARASTSPRRARLSSSPRRARLSPSPRRSRLSPSPRRARLSSSPRRTRPSPSPRRTRLSPSPRRARLSPSPRRARLSPSPRRARFSPSPLRRRASVSPRRLRASPSPPRRARLSPSPRRRATPSPRRLASSSPRRAGSAASARRSPSPKRRRKRSGEQAKAPRRRRSASRARKRRRSASPATSPKPVKTKKKKRARSPLAGSKQRSPRRRSPRRKRVRRASSPPAAAAWSPPPPAPPSPPRTPPPAAPVPLEERRRRREVERAHRRLRDAAGPSKEVFTSGDNILVSVSFKEQERAEGIGRRARRKERRRRRRALEPAPGAAPAPKPVAIIDLERSPFRELTPSPKNVIVLSDDNDEVERDAAPAPAPAATPAAPAPAPDAAQGPPAPTQPASTTVQPEAAEARGPLTPPEPPDSPDAYDPYEPTRSVSASPERAPSPGPGPDPALGTPDPEPEESARDPPSMTLEAAQKTNLSADQVLDRRPLSPIEKVMALLQSTRDISPEEPQPRSAGTSPGAALEAAGGGGGGGGSGGGGSGGGGMCTAAVAPAPRVALPEALAPRAPPKLFLAKPSPIKSDPIKPMPQATKISRLPMPAVVAGVRRRSASPGGGGASPYSPGSSDFGDLFEPPAPPPARRMPRRNKPPRRGKKGKTTVDVKLDDDNLKILDELPSSAVEMQVKSKFLKKLNRQERVVEEVKLVLKPHYNKKHVSKEEYKHILRRAVPKICHNKTGEINPMKIQALVEAYVKKFRKRRKLGQ